MVNPVQNMAAAFRQILDALPAPILGLLEAALLFFIMFSIFALFRR